MPVKATCYWCNREIIGTAKRCARCRLTTYCSKSCQTSSWKAGHRTNCSPHDALSHGKPEKGSEEWWALELDKTLSRWLEQWRNVFRHFAVISLNLPNHGPERVATHCMTVLIQANFMHEDRIRDYFVVEASVRSISSLAEEFPNLKGLTSPPTPYTPTLDSLSASSHSSPSYSASPLPSATATSPSSSSPSGSSSSLSSSGPSSSSSLPSIESAPAAYDPTRVRFVIVLQNWKEEIVRVRCCLWNDLNIPRVRRMPKEVGDELAKDWDAMLMYTIENMLPREVEEKLGCTMRTTRSQYD